MEKLGIIAKVVDPTDWVSSLVVVPKSEGKLRICLDPRDLNVAIKRERYRLPTIEDIATRLAGARVFTVLDVKQGFWHIPLEDESSYLTTFNSPFGRYRWLRMPFGISSAPEVFQRSMHQLIEDLDGIEVIADDFMIYGRGKTDEEAVADHDDKLHAFLKRCEDRNVVLCEEKFKLRQSELPFIGHVVTADGLKPCPVKVKAITEMPAPTNVAGIRRFLGMVQYLSKFLPGLSDLTKPLRELTQKNVMFTWQKSQEDAFKVVKEAISSTPVLRYYCLEDEVTIQCDSSQFGLGAVLLQKGQPVAFASRALTATEQRYVQIEKECLAIVFACEKFHQYIFGREEVTVQSDHKPLEAIFKKPLEAAPARLQRMLLFLQKYRLCVKYVQGKHMYIADTLSRANLTEDIGRSSFVNSLESIDFSETLMVRPERLQELKWHIAEDDCLQEVSQLISNGWPETRNETPYLARAYFNYRDELHAENGLIFKGNRLLVPKCLRKEMLEIAHQGHIGLEGCQRRMREALFWPGMSSDLKALIRQCDSCLATRDSPSREPLESHDFVKRPWSKIGADLCYFDNRTLLVVVDYFSNFIEVIRVHNQTSTSLIKEFQNIYARFGVPDQLVTDNGPQFCTEEFRKFAERWNFEHITSSPRYPQSNGKAENAVKTVKKLFKKCKLSGDNEYLALLNWRNTPSEGMTTSPAQRLMGRRCKTTMPCKGNLLQPKYSTIIDGKGITKMKEKQAKYYNRNSRKRAPIMQGETIRMKLPGCDIWSPGTCIKEVAPRSYLVKVGDSTYRRNRRQLLATGEEKRGNEESYLTEEDLDPLQHGSYPENRSSGKETENEVPSVENEISEFMSKSESPIPKVLRRSTRVRRPPERYGQ